MGTEMVSNNPFNVKVGQVWLDNDTRLKPAQGKPGGGRVRRFIKILAINGDKALVQSRSYGPEDAVLPPWHKRLTEIRLDRFKPTSTGYRLQEE